MIGLEQEAQLKKMNEEEFEEYIMQLRQKFVEINKKWYDLKPGQHFVEIGGWVALFHHIIKETHPEKRYLIACDISNDGNEVTIFEPPECFDTEEELKEYLKKNPDL